MKAPFKAVIVERFIQTLKQRIFKYLYYNNTSKFVDVIDRFVDNYNNSVHNATKFKPVDVNESNQRKAFLNLYRRKYRPVDRPKFSLGQQVLIPYLIDRDPTKFQSRFRSVKYKPDIYVIDKVLHTSPRTKYVVKNVQTG